MVSKKSILLVALFFVFSVSANFIISDLNEGGVDYVTPTESNDSYLARDYIEINTSANVTSILNITVYLYNTSGIFNISGNDTLNGAYVNFSGLNDGIYYFNASVFNSSNSLINTTITRTITIDKTNPLITNGSESDLNDSTVSRSYIYFNFSISEVNPLNISFYLYNSSALVNQTNRMMNSVDSNNTINWTNLKNGNYTFNVTVFDKSGNQNSSSSFQITINDTIRPSIEDVDVDNVAETGADIEWSTTKLANSSVRYGTDEDDLDLTESESPFVLSHVVSLSDLESGTLYYYNVTSCDINGNCNTTGPYNFTTDSTSEEGGGSSNNPSTTGIVTIKTLNETELTNGYTRSLVVNQRIRFLIEGQNHYTTVISMTSTRVKINVSSTPQQKEMSVNDLWKVDVNNDSKYDIQIKLNSINSGAANLTIIRIDENVSASSQPQNANNITAEDILAAEEKNASNNSSSRLSKFVDNLTKEGNEIFWILSIIVIVGLMVLIVYWNMYGSPFKNINEWYQTKKMMRV